MSKFKDYLGPLISVLTLAFGMSWASGSTNQQVIGIHQEYIELKVEVVKLRDTIENLTVRLAETNQRLADQSATEGSGSGHGRRDK